MPIIYGRYKYFYLFLTRQITNINIKVQRHYCPWLSRKEQSSRTIDEAHSQMNYKHLTTKQLLPRKTTKGHFSKHHIVSEHLQNKTPRYKDANSRVTTVGRQRLACAGAVKVLSRARCPGRRTLRESGTMLPAGAGSIQFSEESREKRAGAAGCAKVPTIRKSVRS